jgi:CheY-like chemotaxis protein
MHRNARQPFQVLHVEDDDLDAMNFQRAIRNSRWIESVALAHDGVEALALLRSGRISTRRLIILVDIRMPRMSGLELLEHLRADPMLGSIPVVVMTTSLDDGDLAAAYRAHVAGYLVKSDDGARFRDAVAAFEEYWANAVLP